MAWASSSGVSSTAGPDDGGDQTVRGPCLVLRRSLPTSTLGPGSLSDIVFECMRDVLVGDDWLDTELDKPRRERPDDGRIADV